MRTTHVSAPALNTSGSCVIFDMDGVLARLDRVRRLEFLAAKLSLPAAQLQRQIWDSDFEISAEAGAFVDGAGYLAEFNRRLDRNLSRSDWIAARRVAMTLNTATLQLARRLAQRAPVAMLTNNGWLLKESLPELVPDIVAVFGTHAHASCEFGARKPQPAVFQNILAHYGVEAARSIFIDDEADNIAAARAVGMTAFHYVGTAQLERCLLGLGLL